MKRLCTLLSLLFILSIGLFLLGCAGEVENLSDVDSENQPADTENELTAVDSKNESIDIDSEIQPSDSANEPLPPTVPTIFDGQSAFNYLTAQTDIGPRYPGSPGHLAVRDYMIGELEAVGWTVEQQLFDYQPLPGESEPYVGNNIIGKANVGKGNIIMLGAHYDTRAVSNMSEDKSPGLGAVDGASGVAVLLEMARTLNLDDINNEIWLTFFDLEDNGSNGLASWNWIAGSTYMAQNLARPLDQYEAVVVVDMIGDADQTLYLEGNSDPVLQAELWDIAAELGYIEQFIPTKKHTIIDDHLPFARLGISAVDIIDFDYEHWHRTSDTPDKASAESLERVGHTLQTWLESKE